ncbi:MAG: SpoIVB peptidase [Lachnospiraceae bacterium]|nr:SpoIVB peptidase [Lachnospiraceae bacterium]
MKKVIRNLYKGILFCAVAGLLVAGWYTCYDSVPSQVKLATQREQRMNFKIPASASIETEQGTFQTGLYRPVTMVTGAEEATYQMDVKLLGLIPLKSVEIQVMSERSISAAGFPVGIFLKTKGVMVVGIGSFQDANGVNHEPSKAHLAEGDYILSYNGVEITGKKHFMSLLAENRGTEIILGVERDGTYLEERVTPAQNQSGEYKMGIWIRDNAQGVGTLTFVDENGNFGALGHGITDSDTGELMELGRGSLYGTKIIAVRKGTDGVPGELTGMIEYDDENVIGEITKNTSYGIFGRINLEKLNENGIDLKTQKIGFKQDIYIGPATMISSVNDEMHEYNIEITAIHMGNDGGSKGLEILVTDEELLNLTGGIVQGMSGSPILQDGKVVGAVTHVLVNAPEKGYGIFIEEMLMGE